MKKQITRRLSAIMFTDIIGYTRLMQQDEAKAMSIRAIHREVFAEQHRIYDGEILQYFGDGTLSVFQSAIKAVDCAIAIQRKLYKHEAVPLRIGLHIGDIAYDDTEIYGDSVNLASRIESLGVAGAVLLSGRLNIELRNHRHLSTTSLGSFNLKNVLEPIEIFAIDSDGLVVPEPSQLQGKIQQSTKTIAVLPFVNMSANAENEYISDGMTEEIINALAKIKGLKVTSRTSSFHFKNKNIPIKEIGSALNVNTILEGSIRLAKDKMRITAQLIDVNEDFHFWSETFDRSVDDIFALQDEISLLIADRLREHVGHFDIEDSLVTEPDVSVNNYLRYLEARFLILHMSKTEIEKGMSMLEDVIKTHPNFPYAYLGIHLAYTLLANMGYLPAAEAFVNGKHYLDKAIEIDESLPECQLHLSYEAFIAHWDFKKAYDHLQRSYEMRPSVEYYQSMASYLVAEGAYQAASNYIETALQIDPFHFINFHLKGFMHYCQEQYQSAIGCFDQALEINQSFVPSLLYKGQALVLADRAQEALDLFENCPADGEPDLLKIGGTTLAHAALMHEHETAAGMIHLEKIMSTAMEERALLKLILCRAMYNQEEEAMKLLEKALSIRLSMLIYLLTDPILKGLRSNARFREIVAKVIDDKNTPHLIKRKYKKPLWDEATLRQQRARLEQIMQEEQIYRNPDLTLRDLASALDVPPNYMSQLLNEGFGKNFSEFVNTYRLEAFKSKVADPANRHLTILALAYDAGFNSKTVFNTFFKKMMGTTPKSYWKEVTQ